MKEFGDGARMEILADWGNNKSHVFIAEQIDGKTHFCDPQTKAISVTITLIMQSIYLQPELITLCFQAI